MNEQITHHTNEEMEREESLKRHADEVKKYHRASVYSYAPDSPEEQHFLDWERAYDEKIKKIKKTETEEQGGPSRQESIADDAVGRVSQVLSIIDSIELLPEFADDEEMKKALAKDKSTAKSLIRGLITNHVNQYISLVRAFDKARVEVQERKMTAEEFQAFDERRNLKHNALMSSINIVNRFLAQKFGKIPDDALDEYEEQEEKAGRMVTEVKRIDWPKNIICPAYIDVANREDITSWSIELSRSLSELPL